MEDLEEELLQVAGRSRGAGSKKRSRGRRADSDDDSEDLLGLDSDEDAPAGRGSRGKKGSKRPKALEEEEEDDEEEGDGYGSDLYEDEEDRKRLEAMNELEREMILAERGEKRDKEKQRKEILQKARDAGNKAEARGQRQSNRQKKSTSEKDTAIKQLEAARKKRAKESKVGKRGKVSSARDWSSSGSEAELEDEEAEYQDGSDDDDDADDDGEARPARRPVTRARADSSGAGHDSQAARRGEAADEDGDDDKLLGVRRTAYQDDGDLGEEAAAHDLDDGAGGDDDHDADTNELRSIQLTRTQLEAMCDKPFFNGDGLTGALVRMAYNPSSAAADNGVPIYWMFQIVSIKQHHNPYPFGPRGAPCHKRLELKDGARVVRTLPMTTVSNQPLEDAEIERFARHAGRVGDRPISKRQVQDIKNRIQAAVNFRWDSAKVKEVLAGKRDAGYLPVNIAAEKSRVKRLLEEAKAAPDKDQDKLAALEAQLASLDERSTVRGQEKRNADMTSINARNKEANFNLQIRNVSSRPANAPERKGADPFSRRVTRPNIYWNTAQNKPLTQEEAKAAADSQTTPEKLSVKPHSGKDVRLRASQARMEPAQLIKALPFDIEVKQLQDCSVVPPLHLRLLGPRWHLGLSHHTNADLSGRTLLSVADWHQRAAVNEQQG